MNYRLLFCSQKPVTLFHHPKPSSPLPLKPKTHLKPKPKLNLLQPHAKGFGTTQYPPPETITTRDSGGSGGGGGDEDDDELPDAVIYRLIGRILVSVGAPIGFGLLLLHYFGVVRDQHSWDIPVWLPLSTTFLCFAVSACGIAYGALSTNLDPDQSGSVFGIDEVRHNWVEMWKEENQ